MSLKNEVFQQKVWTIKNQNPAIFDFENVKILI